MTYGTTNSGKSYTLQGTTTSPGIIPRSLEFVFSNINTRPTPSYKPTHNSDVVSLSPVNCVQELESKNKLLTFASVDKHAYINAYKQMQKLLQEVPPIRPSQVCGCRSTRTTRTTTKDKASEIFGRGEGGIHQNNNGRRGNGTPSEGAGRIFHRLSRTHRGFGGARRLGKRLSRRKYEGEGDSRGTRDSIVSRPEVQLSVNFLHTVSASLAPWSELIA